MKTLIIIFFLGLALRLTYFGTISFSYDQARDGFEAIKIWTNDPVKLLGPTVAEIPGLNHGSLFWYVISPFYYFSAGNPFVVKFFLLLVNSVNIFFIYFFTKKLFKNKTISLISAFIFAVSFEQIQYARWVSNPSLAILPVAVFFYAVWKQDLGLAALAFAFCVQFQLFFIYLLAFFPIIIFLNIKNKKVVSRKNILFAFFGFILISPFIIAEFKFHFASLKAILKYLAANQSSSFLAKIFPSVSNLSNHLTLNIERNIISANYISGTLLVCLFFVVGFYIAKKHAEAKKLLFLLIWFISPGILFFFGKSNSFFTLGNGYPLIMLMAFFINEIRVKKNILAIAVLAAIFFNNLNLNLKTNPQGEVLFAYPSDRHYNDEQKAIDWMYTNRDNKMFIIDSVTAPLFANTTWDFGFNYYGKNKYGFLPIWEGFPQNDFAGAKVAYENEIKKYNGLILFLIKEPETAIPNEYFTKYEKYENIRSRKIKEINIGGIIIEKRKMINDIHFSRDDVFKI